MNVPSVVIPQGNLLVPRLVPVTITSGNHKHFVLYSSISLVFFFRLTNLFLLVINKGQGPLVLPLSTQVSLKSLNYYYYFSLFGNFIWLHTTTISRLDSLQLTKLQSAITDSTIHNMNFIMLAGAMATFNTILTFQMGLPSVSPFNN